MDTTIAIEKLRFAASEDRVVRDIFENFSKRDRVWDSVALRPLWLAMKESGRPHPIGKISEVLGLIASVGIGKKHAAANGRVIKVSNLTLDLRALGEAVVGDGRIKDVRKYRTGMQERNLSAVAEAVRSPSSMKVYPLRKASSLSITLTINGKPVVMPLPGDLSPEELAAVIERLRRTED